MPGEEVMSEAYKPNLQKTQVIAAKLFGLTVRLSAAANPRGSYIAGGRQRL